MVFNQLGCYVLALALMGGVKVTVRLPVSVCADSIASPRRGVGKTGCGHNSSGLTCNVPHNKAIRMIKYTCVSFLNASLLRLMHKYFFSFLFETNFNKRPMGLDALLM